MEGSYKLQALQEYDRALRRGRREYSTLTAKGERGILAVLLCSAASKRLKQRRILDR